MINRISFIILFLLSFLFNLGVTANTFSAPADSLRVKWVNGKKYIQHKIEAGETWTILSRRYNCSVNELMEANKDVKMLKIDEVVNVPVLVYDLVDTNKEKSSAPQPVETAKASNNSAQRKTPLPTAVKTPVIHTVKSGETLFAIARKYKQDVEYIKSYNSLKADGIQVGQKLIVNYLTGSGNQLIAQTEPAKVVVPPSKPAEGTALALVKNENAEPAGDVASPKATNTIVPEIKASSPEPVKTEPKVENYFDPATKTVTTVKKGNSGKTMLQVTETGVATLFHDGNQNQRKFYGLHRTAPIGTIVKVTNRMNNQFVYVKIVGILPDTGENDNLIIKMSQAVSEKLNALDTFFQVELSYGLME